MEVVLDILTRVGRTGGRVNAHFFREFYSSWSKLGFIARTQIGFSPGGKHACGFHAPRLVWMRS